MSGAEEVKMQIKVTINRDKNKVLFAEAGSDFADVLLSFLLLPLGTIASVVKNHFGDDAPVIGSLSSLYNGVANLDSTHFITETEKGRLLSPTCPYESRLRELRFNVSSPNPASSDSGKTDRAVLTNAAGSFIISDDLQLMPNAAGSILKTLTNLGISLADMDGAFTRTVAFGLNEVMILLEESLVSKNPLSAVLFRSSQLNLATPKYEHGNTSFHQINEEVIAANSKKMILTVMLRKSTNKLLFAQADHDFVNFLFGLLTLPLGRAEWYFNSNSGLKNIDNLHHSLAAYNSGCKLMSESFKDAVLKPYWNIDYYYNQEDYTPLNFYPNCDRRHANESIMYMVRDDLTVSPLGVTSGIALLKDMNISLSDVKEMDLQIGLEEVTKIGIVVKLGLGGSLGVLARIENHQFFGAFLPLFFFCHLVAPIMRPRRATWIFCLFISPIFEACHSPS